MVRRRVILSQFKKYKESSPDLPPLNLNSLTSYPFLHLPLDCVTCRMPATHFTLALQRKLRAEIFQPDTICSCGNKIDVYGDHMFSCCNSMKATLHNSLRDCLYQILIHLAHLAKLVDSSAVIRREGTGLIPSYPNLRPADVMLKLDPVSLPPYTHLLIDVTTVPPPPLGKPC